MAHLSYLCPELDRAHVGRGGWRWYLRGAEGAAALAVLEACAAGAGSVQPVQSKRHRRLELCRADGRAVFAKHFVARDPGDLLRQTLRLTGHRLGFKGAAIEAAHSLLAERRGQRVPRLFALGERRLAGLVTRQTLLFEALEEHDPLGLVLARAQGDEVAQRALLERAADLADELLGAGLVHLDFNHKNVMIARGGRAGDRVVDLEQVVPAGPERADLVAYTYGYLYRWELGESVPQALYDALALERMARQLGGPPAPAVLQAYRLFQKRGLPRRQRLRLARVGLAGMSRLRARARLKPTA